MERSGNRTLVVLIRLSYVKQEVTSVEQLRATDDVDLVDLGLGGPKELPEAGHTSGYGANDPGQRLGDPGVEHDIGDRVEHRRFTVEDDHFGAGLVRNLDRLVDREHRERGPDGEEEIALHCGSFGPLKILGTQALTETDRGGFENPAAGRARRVGLTGPDPVKHDLHVVAIVTFETSDLAGGAVDLDDPTGRGTRALVQFVDILGDEGVEFLSPLEFDERLMTSVGINVRPQGSLGSLGPVGAPHRRVADVEVDIRRALGSRVPGPQSVWAPKIGDAGVGGDTGSGQHGDRLSLVDQAPSGIDRLVEGVHGGIVDRR